MAREDGPWIHINFCGKDAVPSGRNRTRWSFCRVVFDGSTKEHSIKAYLDNRELPLTVQVNRGAEVRQKYIRSINEIEGGSGRHHKASAGLAQWPPGDIDGCLQGRI